MSLRNTTSGIAGLLLLALLGAPAGVLAAEESGFDESPGNPRAGRDLFVQKGCMRCHSIWRADDKKGPSLASVGMGRNLYELAASVWSHWSQMNAVMQREKLERISLDATEFKDIIAYLYYLNYYAEPGDPASGRKVFRAKGCVRCHALEPLQASRMPGLAAYEMADFRSPIALAVAVWNHGGDMARRMEQLGITWPRFGDREVADMVALIRSLTGTVPRTGMTLPGNFRSGLTLFRSKSCAGCHTRGAQGIPATAPDPAVAGTAASLSSLIAGLWNHYPKMSERIAASGVSYPRITQGEMEDLFSYLYWVRTYGLEGNSSIGRRLYQSKECASCHSSESDKPARAPELVGSKTSRSVYSLLSAIWNHGPQMETLLEERRLSWPSLTGEEMRNLVAFLRSADSSRQR